MDEEEAELRKEQLRLQNLALAQQLADRAHAERKREAAAQLAKDVGKAGFALAKLAAIGAAILVGLVIVLVWINDIRESDRRRNETIEEAQAECRRGDGTTRVFVTLPDGEHASVHLDEFDKMPRGTRRGKKCSEILGGEYPY